MRLHKFPFFYTVRNLIINYGSSLCGAASSDVPAHNNNFQYHLLINRSVQISKFEIIAKSIQINETPMDDYTDAP